MIKFEGDKNKRDAHQEQSISRSYAYMQKKVKWIRQLTDPCLFIRLINHAWIHVKYHKFLRCKCAWWLLMGNGFLEKNVQQWIRCIGMSFLLKHIIIDTVSFPPLKWRLFIYICKEKPVYIDDVAYLIQRSTLSRYFDVVSHPEEYIMYNRYLW